MKSMNHTKNTKTTKLEEERQMSLLVTRGQEPGGGSFVSEEIPILCIATSTSEAEKNQLLCATEHKQGQLLL